MPPVVAPQNQQAGYQQVSITGDGDIADICRLTCLEQGVAILDDGQLPALEVHGTKVQLRIGEKL